MGQQQKCEEHTWRHHWVGVIWSPSITRSWSESQCPTVILICVFLNAAQGGGSSLLQPRSATHLLCTDSKTGDRKTFCFTRKLRHYTVKSIYLARRHSMMPVCLFWAAQLRCLDMKTDYQHSNNQKQPSSTKWMGSPFPCPPAGARAAQRFCQAAKGRAESPSCSKTHNQGRAGRLLQQRHASWGWPWDRLFRLVLWGCYLNQVILQLILCRTKNTKSLKCNRKNMQNPLFYWKHRSGIVWYQTQCKTSVALKSAQWTSYGIRRQHFVTPVLLQKLFWTRDISSNLSWPRKQPVHCDGWMVSQL